MREEFRYSVLGKKYEAENVATLSLALPGKKIPPYAAGQYIIVYIPELGTPEGKAYSISSAPSEGVLTITVRAVGRYSGHLVALKPGETVVASLPYGFFYTELSERPLIMIAAGIGITPFRSIIVETIKKQQRRNVALFHSERSVQNFVFAEEFQRLRKSHPQFAHIQVVTGEKTIEKKFLSGRMNAKTVIDTLGRHPDAEYMICGQSSFVADIRCGLTSSGVSESVIYTEDITV